MDAPLGRLPLPDPPAPVSWIRAARGGQIPKRLEHRHVSWGPKTKNPPSSSGSEVGEGLEEEQRLPRVLLWTPSSCCCGCSSRPLVTACVFGSKAVLIQATGVGLRETHTVTLHEYHGVWEKINADDIRRIR